MPPRPGALPAKARKAILEGADEGARALPQPLRTHPVGYADFEGAGVPATRKIPNRVRADEG